MATGISAILMPAPMSPTPEAMLAHADWVRSLARCMVSDAQLAEDLAQDTWVSALRSPPSQVLNMRSWLAQILRNVVRQDRRAAGRRKQREEAAARPERVPPTADVVEKVSSHRLVVETVLELDEPYRTAVLLRFFEGMAPRKIAQRLDVPVSTVHTRIQRGLATLRGRLERQHGGRKAWLMTVLPLVRSGGPSAALAGAVVMKSKMILTGALVVAIGLVAAWPLLTQGAEPGPVQPAPGPTPFVSAEPSETDGRGEVSREALPVARNAGAGPAGELASPQLFQINGRLVDSEARPLPGMGLQFETADDSGPTAVTAAMGAFEITAPAARGRIVVSQQGWTTVMAAEIDSGRPPEHSLVVAAPAMQLSGRVVDEFGTPVPEASVELELPEGFRTRFTENSDASSNRGWRTVAEESGEFGMTEVAKIAGATLVARSPGYDDDIRPLPDADAELEIVLRRTARAEDTVSGQVIDDRGAVVEGAWVAIGGSSTRTDAQGEFTLKLVSEESMGQFLSEMGTTDRILAVKQGYLPARLEQPTDAMGRPTDWPSTVLLRLPGRPLTLGGMVVDADGEPLPDLRVWANESTVFGIADSGLTTLENVMAGSDERWSFVETDGSGRFSISGLADQEYSLRALNSRTLLMVDSEPVRAGQQDVVIRMPKDAYHPVVRGQVVSRTGIPLGGISVIPQGDTFRMRVRGEPISTNHIAGETTRTDANGRFSIENLPRTDIYLRLQGEDILPLEYGRGVEGGIEALGPVDNLMIEVSVRVHVQVELTDPASADQIRVLNVEGNPLPINVFSGRSRSTSRVLDLVDGRSPVFVVPEEAAEMVFLKADRPARTVRLSLVPGEVNRIR